MSRGRLLAVTITAITVALIILGTLVPTSSAFASAGEGTALLRPPSSPQVAVESLVEEISRKDWAAAYSGLANKNEFTEQDFVRDLTGTHPSLRSYAALDGFDLHPLHASADSAEIRVDLRWSTVVGTYHEVNYLRWDVIYRGPEDDWGAQDVESPHVRIVDMHPVDRGGGVVLLGELLNEDVVPAFVTVKATLLRKDGSPIATEDSFDKISHVLLPRQVTPFLIEFHKVALSQVDSVHMEPSSTLIAASADPVIGIEDQQLNGGPQPSLSGKLRNQSGEIVNVAHVLGTFYDSSGQLIWVSDGYVDRALLPDTPASFTMFVPPDIASKTKTERAVTTAYLSNRFQ